MYEMGWSYARKGVIVVDLEIMPLKHGIERDTQVQLCKVHKKTVNSLRMPQPIYDHVCT